MCKASLFNTKVFESASVDKIYNQQKYTNSVPELPVPYKTFLIRLPDYELLVGQSYPIFFWKKVAEEGWFVDGSLYVCKNKLMKKSCGKNIVWGKGIFLEYGLEILNYRYMCCVIWYTIQEGDEWFVILWLEGMSESRVDILSFWWSVFYIWEWGSIGGGIILSCCVRIVCFMNLFLFLMKYGWGSMWRGIVMSEIRFGRYCTC